MCAQPKSPAARTPHLRWWPPCPLLGLSMLPTMYHSPSPSSSTYSSEQNKSGSIRRQPPFCPFPSSWHPPSLASLLEGAFSLKEVREGPRTQRHQRLGSNLELCPRILHVQANSQGPLALLGPLPPGPYYKRSL